MDSWHFSLFLAAALVLIFTPGPDMFFCAATGLRAGRGAGIMAGIGTGLGGLSHTIAASTGLAALAAASPLALGLLKYAGALYLAWLAWGSFRSRDSYTLLARRGADALWPALRAAWLTNLANPKVILFFLAFLPQFIDPKGWPVALQMLLLGAILSFLAAGFNCLIGSLGGGLAAALARNPKFARWLPRFSALCLFGMALALLFQPTHKVPSAP
jgi:threonine/homoserine/homoserine lactone efflux protein